VRAGIAWAALGWLGLCAAAALYLGDWQTAVWIVIVAGLWGENLWLRQRLRRPR